MPGFDYYQDLKSVRQWEEHQATLKEVYNKPKRNEQHNPQYPHKDYEKSNEYTKKPKKPQWTAEDQALEDSLWDE